MTNLYGLDYNIIYFVVTYFMGIWAMVYDARSFFFFFKNKKKKNSFNSQFVHYVVKVVDRKKIS